ncbi:MAG: DUF2235 domain-containing protein [Armatimonadetes bacterium]|nr:DUF2235 domain-containing protein [Armatimonadota bacterium]
MRKIVICCDGTWNAKESPNQTNVIKLSRWLTSDSDQLVQYFDGVGTQGSLLDRLLGGIMGKGLSDRIKEAHRFLVANYQPGDQLYFFGFSRGAYTVRSLSGFIRKAGLLKSENLNLVDNAYDLYRNDLHPDHEIPTTYRARYSVEPTIHFIGVWDTVGALGIPTDWATWLGLNRSVQFHDVKLSTRVRFAYQALSIDDRRKPFAPAIWEQQPAGVGTQTLEQAWFPGVHTQVGGGYSQSGLSSHALRWMQSRAEGAGLRFDAQKASSSSADACHEPIDNSVGFLYSLWKTIDRPIGKLSEEGLHEVVTKRLTVLTDYQPPTLVEYLKSETPRIFKD